MRRTIPTTRLDFGLDVFLGAALWLEVGVRGRREYADANSWAVAPGVPVVVNSEGPLPTPSRRDTFSIVCAGSELGLYS